MELQKNFSKIDSTTKPDPLLMKITQTTQNCRKNTGKFKVATLLRE